MLTTGVHPCDMDYMYSSFPNVLLKDNKHIHDIDMSVIFCVSPNKNFSEPSFSAWVLL